MKNKNPVIAVFGHYGNRNLGDESIIAATIAQLRSRLPNVEIICISLRPDDSSRRHDVEAYHIRYSKFEPNREGLIRRGQAADTDQLPWNQYTQQQETQQNETVEDSQNRSTLGALKDFLKNIPGLGRIIKVILSNLHWLVDCARELNYFLKVCKYLKKVDLLIVAGSNQFLDNFDGTWGFPATLLKWGIAVKLAGAKLAFVSVGAGPLEKNLSKRLIRTTLRFADYISYRDSASKELIETDTYNYGSFIYPDLAYGLRFEKKPNPITTNTHSKPVVALNPMPFYDSRYWCEVDDDRYLNYVKKLAKLSEKLIENDYPMFLFGTMWRDTDVVTDVINAIRPEIKEKVDVSKLFRNCETVSELVDLIQSADIVVATRFHGNVLALHAERPVLGICYHRKAADVMNAMGQNAYHEPFDTFEVDSLWRKLLKLECELPNEIEKIKAKNSEYKTLIDEQWDKVVSLIK